MYLSLASDYCSVKSVISATSHVDFGETPLTWGLPSGLTSWRAIWSPMRNLLSILLAISLSWVTTGYACSMDRLAGIKAVCCCPHDHEAVSASGVDVQNSEGAQDRCCDVVVSATVDQYQPGVASAVYPALDMPTAAIPASAAWSITAPRALFVTSPPPARGPPSAGTRTYLATARLRL